MVDRVEQVLESPGGQTGHWLSCHVDNGGARRARARKLWRANRTRDVRYCGYTVTCPQPEVESSGRVEPTQSQHSNFHALREEKNERLLECPLARILTRAEHESGGLEHDPYTDVGCRYLFDNKGHRLYNVVIINATTMNKLEGFGHPSTSGRPESEASLDRTESSNPAEAREQQVEVADERIDWTYVPGARAGEIRDKFRDEETRLRTEVVKKYVEDQVTAFMDHFQIMIDGSKNRPAVLDAIQSVLKPELERYLSNFVESRDLTNVLVPIDLAMTKHVVNTDDPSDYTINSVLVSSPDGSPKVIEV